MPATTTPTARTVSALPALAIVLCAAVLAGCGQKGALFQTDPTEIEVGGAEEDENGGGNDDDGSRP